MSHKKMLFLMLCLSFKNVLIADEETPTFLIKKDTTKRLNRMSRNSLKESIGKQAKKSFDATVNLARSVGSLQITISRLQQQALHENKEGEKPNDLSNVFRVATKFQHGTGALQVNSAHVQSLLSRTLTCLVDNAQPFKKAGKDELRKTLLTVKDVTQTIRKQIAQYEQLKKTITPEMKQEVLLMSLLTKASALCSSAVTSLQTIKQQMGDDECLKQV